MQQLLLGRSPFGEPGEWSDAWVALVHCLGAGYLPAAYLATIASARRSVAELRSGRAGGDIELADIAPLPPYAPWSLSWGAAGLAGAVLAFLGPWLTEPGEGTLVGFWSPSTWSPEVVWHRVLGLWIGLWLGWFGLALVLVSGRLSLLARQLPAMDLFDPSPLGPFVRQGLSNGLAAAGLATVIGLLGFDEGVTPMLALFGTVSVLMTIGAVAMPLFGVQRRIRAARQTELAWCETRIAAARARVRQGDPAPDQPGLSDLLAYRKLVEGVSSWPLDTPALRRVLLYLVIPLVSWLASVLLQAVAERAVMGN